MDWKAFFASVLHALAWPAAVVLVIYWLREPLRKRLSYLRRVRWPGGEAEFGEAVEEAETAAAQTELPPAPPPSGEPALVTELAAEIRTAPRAAVIEAWQAVEREMLLLAREAGLVPEAAPAAMRWVQTGPRKLAQHGLIDPALGQVIEDLRQARNLAAHADSYEVDQTSVVDYVKLAGRVRAALRLAREAQVAAQEGRTAYDLLVYHDLSDPTPSSGGTIPEVGEEAEARFGLLGHDLHVVAVGPGIHPGRVTVVLAHGNRPMEAMQDLLDRQPD